MPPGPVSVAKQITEMSRLAADIKALLGSQRDILGKAGLGFPPGVMEGLSQLRDNLEKIQPGVAACENELAQLRALAATSSVINSSLDLTTVLNEVMDTIIRLMGAERGFLMLKDEQAQLQFRIARNVDRESLDSSTFQVSRTILGQVAESGDPVVTTNAQADPRFSAQESVVGYNLRSIICVPLKYKNVVTGVIYVDNRIRTGLFGEKERDLLAAFANQAAVAIENARQFQQVTELKNLLDNVFASIVSGVITTNVDDTITLCNQAAANILGRVDVKGQSLSQALPGDEGFAEIVKQVKSGQRVIVGHEVRYTQPTRGVLDLSLNMSPLKGANHAAQGLAIVLDDLTEKKRLESKYEVFKKMVPPAVINRLNPDTLALGGTRKEVSIVFADIQGFTSLSETQDPEVLIKVLNRYIGTVAEAMLLFEATVDKFIGDAVMGFFNAPDDQPDHAVRAVRTALRMRDDVAALQQVMEPRFRLSFRVAVHVGEAVVGLVGTQDRLDYTIIGDTVNTAKRLQENGIPDKVIISEATYRRVQDIVIVKPLDPLLVKGKVQPVPVYELLDLKR